MAAGKSQTSIKAHNGSTAAPLHVCADCNSELVQPVAWEQTARLSEWRLWRRCPECEWVGDGIHHESAIDKFDEQLDFGTRELAEELRALEQSNMEQAAETFLSALHADLILPEDF